MAIRQGLPPIGATLTNAYGIMWVVDGHTFAPSVMTLGRTKKESDPRDLYPVSIPQNLSKKLQDMLQELHACTPKDFVPLDTVPHLRPDQAMPYSHSVDSVSDPNRILLFFDSARIHEAAFAHELAHVWLELVEGIEDYRVLEDLTDSVRYGQVQRIQSFVLDFRVNDLIRSRGIDTFELENDRVKSLEQLAIASSNGYQPPSRWESVAMAMLLAEVFIESTEVLTRADDIFATLREKLSEEWALAEDLAEIIRAEPRSSGDSVRQCIDKALTVCFTHAGEHLDLEKDLIERPASVNWRDKWPGWLSELTPQQKCEVGKAMARSGLGGYAKVQLLNSLAGAGVQFSTDGESWTEPVALPFRLPDPTRPHGAASRAMEINEQNRRRQMEQFERMKNSNPGRRAYAPGEARFITQVRMEEMLAGEHPYAYCENNPITYVDPSGNQAVAIIGGIAAADEWNPVGWGLTAGLVLWGAYELCKSRPLPPISIPWPGPAPSPSPVQRPRPRPGPRPYVPIEHSKKTKCTCYIYETGPIPPCRGQIDLGVTVTIPPGDFENGRQQCQSLRGSFTPLPGCASGHINCK
jgi:RHS repeat-associated protein